MRTLKSSIAASILASVALAPLAQADNLAVIVSPNGDPTTKKAEIVDILKLMTGTVEPGEEAILFDGLSSKSICKFVVPNRRSYASDKAKLNANRSCVGKLMTFASSADAGATAGLLDLPATLRTLVRTADMQAIDAVIIFGSPLYNDLREPSSSMAHGYVPSDGHITAQLTASPFGFAGLAGSLEGTPVHLSSDGYDWTLNSRHEEMVHRFTWLGVDTLGGSLVTFNADRDQMIDRVLRGVKTSPVTFERSASDKLEMIPVILDRGPGLPIHEREISTAPITGAEMRRAIDVEVGITWDCTCDMDIYVRPFPNAEVIYYGRTKTREGTFYRDYRNGRDLLNGLESVTLDAPVDLSEMVIGVNFYSGDAPEGVAGEIRLSVGNRTYAKPFVISATSGNQADGAVDVFQALEAPNERWVVMSADLVVAQ